MNIPRRQFVRLAASAAAGSVSSRFAWADTYPTRPVRMIVPFAPGGPTDIVARLLTQKLGDHLGRQFYVENVAGAGGNLGMRAAARAAPDGYTLVLVSSSYMVNPSLYPKVPYDQTKDFVPVTLPAYAPNILVASPSLPVKSVKELADFVLANPGKLSFASAGMGTRPICPESCSSCWSDPISCTCRSMVRRRRSNRPSAATLSSPSSCSRQPFRMSRKEACGGSLS
jgi:tripartite-type tricarboxylate transporter receptor subunit TctC